MLTASREKLDKLVGEAWRLMEEETLPDAQVGVAMLIVEVKDATDNTAFYTFCTDKRTWVQKALTQEAVEAIAFSEVEVDGD